jgi:phosphopantothenoylcysteine decarboxylase/phosphopantothenate--cysteine ligase
MGYAIAGQAYLRGARVTLVSGPVHLNAPQGVDVVNVETTRELYEVMIARCQEYDVIIQAAAPADYRFANPSGQKLKKHGGETLRLEMIENPDIAAAVGERKKPGQVLVCFAAETENLLDNAKVKLQKKNADMIVANDVSKPGAGFSVNTNIATIITVKGILERPLQSKVQLADDILDMVLSIKAE